DGRVRLAGPSRHTPWHARTRSAVALCKRTYQRGRLHSRSLVGPRNGSQIDRRSNQNPGGAGGARTHDRQIMRKPTRLVSPLDGDLLTALPLVSRDPPGLAGMSRNQPRWDGCSHNVLTRRYPAEVANL